MIERTGTKRQITDGEFQELGFLGMQLFNGIKNRNFEIHGDSQELVEHQGIPELIEEVNAVSHAITDLTNRRSLGQEVNWTEYIELKERATVVMDKIIAIES